jgi:hypothetical protein
MAKIVLKDPNSPSLKKVGDPPSIKYKRKLKKSMILNAILLLLNIAQFFKPTLLLLIHSINR